MVDADQRWDRVTAVRVGREPERYDLTWIEEPLDAYDAEAHAALVAALDTPVATGEMLTSFGEHAQIMGLADYKGCALAPHFVLAIHVHLSAAYPGTAWAEHFEWLEPLFNERLRIADGRLIIPSARWPGRPARRIASRRRRSPSADPRPAAGRRRSACPRPGPRGGPRRGRPP